MRVQRLRPVGSRTTGARRQRPPRARYAMPAVDNPRGLTLPVQDRPALLADGAMVIEDDAYAELRFDGPAPPPLLAEAPNRVLHVGTFSKTLCPGLRIGWLVVPRRLRRRALRIKQGRDLQANSLGQAILEDYLAGSDGGRAVDFDARLARLRRFYRVRATRLARALRQHLPDWRFDVPVGGFAIWIEAPANGRGGAPVSVDEKTLLRAALAEGVMFDPGSMFRPDGAATPSRRASASRPLRPPPSTKASAASPARGGG